VRKVHVSDLVLDDRCQARETINSDAIAEYSLAYESGVELPPISVFAVSGKLYVVDGYHRAPAAIKAGLDFIRINIVGEGTLDDAAWYATGVNQSHGVRRSNADKRRAVRMALETEIGVEQSTQTLAKHVGVSVELATEVRRAWESARHQTPDRRKDSAGRWQPSRRDRTDTSTPKTAKSNKSRSEPPEKITEVEAPEALPFEPAAETREPMPMYGRVLLRIAADLKSARRAALDALPTDAELNGVRQRVESSIKEAEAAIKLAEPVVCTKCGGDGCDPCGSRGWVTKLVAGVR
jgi:hypothetical protein